MGKRPSKPGFKSGSKKPPQPEAIRLNRFIANAGVCSRRDADELIQSGKIKVNGKVVTELGTKVLPKDKVIYQGKVLRSEKLQYVLLNKPNDFITTMDDPHNRKTVMTLVKNACNERIFPVGRLDRKTTGLLLFTNDGELAKRLTHPSHQIKKIYQVELENGLVKHDFEQILKGIDLDDGLATVDELAIISDDHRHIGLQLHIGRNRIVRRIFEHLGYKVKKLDRVMFGPLTKKDLPRGKWRHLSAEEVRHLKGSVR
jgi:23S rRNA pseudouridine2605 synthase